MRQSQVREKLEEENRKLKHIAAEQAMDIKRCGK
jgi:hypothetical protein